MALRRTLRTALPALAAAGVLALTGCAGGSNASPSASESSSAASTPAIDTRPTPASSTAPARNVPAPELPEAAKQNTKEGFEAFTQYWLDTVTYAYETGDTAPLAAASEPTCATCNDLVRQSQETRSGGGWNVGPTWQVRDFVTDMSLDPAKRAQALYTATESPSAEFAADGSVRQTFNGEPAVSFEIYAIFTDGGWRTSESGNA